MYRIGVIPRPIPRSDTCEYISKEKRVRLNEKRCEEKLQSDQSRIELLELTIKIALRLSRDCTEIG